MRIPTKASMEIRDRLRDQDGLPQEIYRNRGRLSVWQEVTDVSTDVELRMAANVMEGDATGVDELLDHEDGTEVEVTQRCLVELVVFHPLDDDRAMYLDAMLEAALEAILPRDPVTGARDRTLGGIVDHIRADEVQREGLAVDTTPQVSGLVLVLELTFSAETVAG